MHRTRIGHVLYSRDIVKLSCCKGAIPTYYGNDVTDIVMQTNKPNNVLTKFRFILTDEDPNQMDLTPIKYQDDVFMEYNVVDDPKSKRLSHNSTLNVKPSTNHVFKIYNAVSPGLGGIIKLGDQVVIASSAKGNSSQKYLVVGADKRVKTDGTKDEATKFTIVSSLGCGPNWVHDQDTRGEYDLMTRGDVQDQAISQAKGLSEQLKKQEGDLSNEEKKYQLQCLGQVNKEKKINEQLRAELEQLTTNQGQA